MRVILAGGAWTSLFCASLGVRLPQLKVLSSVMRTAPVAGAPDTCTYMNDVAYRRRLDGGYTIARGSGFVVPMVPDSLRYLREFLPTLRKESGHMKLRLNAQSFMEWSSPAPLAARPARVLSSATGCSIPRRTGH